MDRLSNPRKTNEAVQVSIWIRRTPQRHFFHWIRLWNATLLET